MPTPDLPYRHLLLEIVPVSGVQSFDSQNSREFFPVMVRGFFGEEEFFQAQDNQGQTSPTFEGEMIIPPRLQTRLGARGVPGWSLTQASEGAVRLAPPASVLELGHQLFESLPGDIKNLLKRRSAKGTRLKIVSRLSYINALPWECLRDVGNQPLQGLVTAGIVRSVPYRLPPPPVVASLPLRVLVVAPNPKAQFDLNTEQELQPLYSALRNKSYKVEMLAPSGRTSLPTVGSPSLANFQNRLAEFLPHIVHFVGHGATDHGEGNIVMEDESGRPAWIDPEELCSLLPVGVGLLCLSTSPSNTGDPSHQNYYLTGLNRLASARGNILLPTTIVNQTPLSVEDAAFFWEKFYSFLLPSGDVESAFRRAQHEFQSNTIKSHGSHGVASFALVIRDNIGHSIQVVKPQVTPIVAQALTFSDSDGETPAPQESVEALQIQARLESTLANSLTSQLQSLGNTAPEILKRHAQKAQQEAEITTLTLNSRLDAG